MPHWMSLVMALFWSPPSSQPNDRFRTLGLQCCCGATHSLRRSSKAVSLKKKCSVSLNTGVLPQSKQTMSMSSSGSRVRPQLSHWSPLAPSNPQWGHLPPTYRSARKRLSVSQNGCDIVSV